MSEPTSQDLQALERRIQRRGLLLAGGFMFAIGVVNATSKVMEADRRGIAIDPVFAWFEEMSGVGVLVLLFPLVAIAVRRVPIDADTWRQALPVHALFTLPFAALHIAGMVLTRKLYAVAFWDRGYVFFDNVAQDLLYEYRKELLAYVFFVLILWLVRSLEEHKREVEFLRSTARSTGRLTLKCGGQSIWLDADEVLWAKAAGNYVEVQAGGATHLARMSLTALHDQLQSAGVDVVRVHRSYLVNRARVARVKPSGDGDIRIEMSDGSELRGSRRYRDDLMSGLA